MLTDVGRILAHLKERGLDRNTVVIFASDNGGYVGLDKQSGRNVPVTNNAPLRSGKGALYEGGILRARKLKSRVISVGNLSTGGSGKTPFVILLGGLLKARGISFDVLSRGYGRATRGVLLVDPAGSAQEFGDEPLLIARRLQVPVIVGEDRYRAGCFAAANG